MTRSDPRPRELSWLDDIIRCHAAGLARWQEAHRNEATGALTFVREDGPYYEVMRSTLNRLRDYRDWIGAPRP